jgi:antitoxin component YwqK of YwqJK toxin-antitoxin module
VFEKGGGNYINGIKDGPWNEGSGKGNYINGNRDGTWSYSYSFGEVYKEEIYDNGVLIEKKFL